MVDIVPLEKQEEVGDVSLESKTNGRFRLLGFRNPLRKIPLIVSRMTAAAGSGHPLVPVDGRDCGFRSLMKLVEKASLKVLPVSAMITHEVRKRARVDSSYQAF